jgi:hypothetical protein
MDSEGPYRVRITPTRPEDQDTADVISAIMTEMVNRSFAEYQQDFTDALVHELMYGELPDA